MLHMEELNIHQYSGNAVPVHLLKSSTKTVIVESVEGGKDGPPQSRDVWLREEALEETCFVGSVSRSFALNSRCNVHHCRFL